MAVADTGAAADAGVREGQVHLKGSMSPWLYCDPVVACRIRDSGPVQCRVPPWLKCAVLYRAMCKVPFFGEEGV